MVDITQQRAAERALAESERRFRTLATASPAGIFSATFDGRVIYANDRLAEIYGIEVAEADALRWLDRVAPASRERARRDGHGGRRRRRPDVDGRPARHGRRRAAGCASTWPRSPPTAPAARDVRRHDRRRHRRGRGRPRARPRARPSTACWPTTRATASRATTSRAATSTSRPRARRSLGYRPEELVGRTAAELGFIHPEDARRRRRARARGGSKADRPTATAAWRVVRPDGSVRWLETAVRSVPDADGDPYQVVAVTRDVTERKDAETRARPPGPARRADRAAQPRAVPRPPRAGAAPRATRRGAARSRCCSSTSTASSSSTTASATPPATSCWSQVAAPAAARRCAPADTVARFGGDEFTVLVRGRRRRGRGRAPSPSGSSTRSREPFVVDGRRGRSLRRASASRSPASGDAAPRSCCATPTPRCTAPRRAAARRYELFDDGDARRRARAAASSRARCAARSSAASCGCTTSRSSTLGDGAHRGRRGAGALGAPRARAASPPGEFIPLAEETGLIVADRRAGCCDEACRQAARWHGALGRPARVP